MPKISIIVPIYNVERYLPACLDSVLNQTFWDFEVICINDGSPDGCGQILAEYAKKDSRIKVINKSNSGYGDSMNRGLDMATGEYIGIVEPDDFVEPDMFEKLYEVAIQNNAEVVKSNFFEYYEQTDTNIVKNLIPDYCFNTVIVPSDYPAVFKMMPSIWSAIYSKKFLDENNIRFLSSPGASYQDTGFTFKVWSMAKRACFIPEPLLHYRSDNAGSSVKSVAKVFCVCDEFKEIRTYLQNTNRYNDLKYIFAWIKYHIYMWNWKRLKEPAKSDFFMTFAQELKEHFFAQDLSVNLFGKKHFKRAVNICRHPRRFLTVYKLQHLPNAIVNKLKHVRRRLK
ncbi:MAG: glycosyltransferase [Alphaproteobacteria bacterium]|nr:glycosyltransferase [Alphaproteobacteria bacterium]